MSARAWRESLPPERLARYLRAGRPRVVESLGCRSDHAGCYLALLREVRLGLAELVQRRDALLERRALTHRQIENLADNRVPAATLRGVGEGHTAIVLGGGPPLERHLEWVTRHRDRLCVLAVSGLCERLDAIGLVPDVVVATDPRSIPRDIGKRWLPHDDVTLVSAFHVAPALLQQWRGPRLYLGERLPWAPPSEDGGSNIVAVGPTLSHTALWLAHAWGFARILLAGVDLCHAPGGDTRVSDSLEAVVGALPSNHDTQVTTYDGRTAGTSLPFEEGVRELDAIGRRVNAHGTRLFNLSGEAARVDSVPCLDVAELELPEGRPRIAPETLSPASAEHLARTLRETRDASRHYKAIRALCRRARTALDAPHEPNQLAVLYDGMGASEAARTAGELATWTRAERGASTPRAA